MKFGLVVAILTLVTAGCTSASIDGQAQEERRDSTEYYHTSYPATAGKYARPAAEPQPADSAAAETAPGDGLKD